MAQANNNTSAQIGKRLADGEQAQKIAAEFGMTETSFSRSRSQYYEAYISILQTELNAAKTAATQLQGVNNGLQKSCDKLQTTVTELQANASTAMVAAEQVQVMETNLQAMASRLQQSETNLQVVSERLQVSDAKLQQVTTNEMEITKHLQVSDAKLQEVTTKLQQSETDLQQVTTKLQDAHQQLQVQKAPIKEQKILTHPRFLLWAIFFFEGYNGWQLYENMKLQQFPYFMAFVFATFFGLASVTALAANHRWGVILCVTAAFFSNAIHADLFGVLSLESVFYTLLPCLLILLFADMYKNKNNSLTI